MTDDRKALADRLLEEAMQCPPDERRAFLDSACKDDPALRREIEELLPFVQATGADDGFLESPVPRPTDLAASTELPSTEAGPPETYSSREIGPYRLLQKLGEGGMGEVWLAEQSAPVRRRVALKIIKRGMDSKQVVARFEAERQALAMMDHPSIAKVYDAGVTERGRPYFAMEHVKGVPITDHCDRQRLTNRERLQLMTRVCEAVQHAHQKAIIHRDLKPSNVLVTIQDGRAIPKVIDFGVAKAIEHKLTAQTMFTELGVMIGTPEYMSPEQAELTGQDVDTRTDVYSLGVILYALLVGALPFDSEELRSAGFEGIRRKILEEEPPTPSARLSTLGDQSTGVAERRRVDLPGLRRELRGDLDWITLKALEKDRTRRYGSPSELAADIARYLADEPVLATPPSTAYRVRKFVRRNRLAVGAAVLVLSAVIAGLGGIAWQARRAAAAEREKREAAELAAVSGQIDFHMAKAPGAFVKYGLGFLNPRAGEGRELTVRQMLEEAASDLDFIFGDQPTAEAGARALLGDVYYSLLEPDASLEQYDRAIEIIAAEAAGKDGAYTPWHDVLIGFLNSRQIVGISAGEEGSDKMYALRDRIYETGFVILRHHEPELVEALKRVAEIASNNTAPAADEWISLIEGLEQRCDRLDPPMNHRTLQAVAIIVGIAATHLHNHFDLPDKNVAWWFIYNRLDGSPFDHARTQTMMLWLIVYGQQEEPPRNLEIARDLVEIQARSYPPNHWYRIHGRSLLGASFARVGRYDDAESVLLQAHDDMVAALGYDGYRTGEVRRSIGRLYEQWGQPEKLAAFQSKFAAYEND